MDTMTMGELFALECFQVLFLQVKLTSERGILRLRGMRIAHLCVMLAAMFPTVSRPQAPVFVIEQQESSIHFHVKASTKISGKFDKWDASLTFISPEETTGVLEVTIQAAAWIPEAE